jgi:hypothetical protein
MVRYRLKTNLEVLVHLKPFDGARTPRLCDTLSNNPIINCNNTNGQQEVLFLVVVVNITSYISHLGSKKNQKMKTEFRSGLLESKISISAS